MKSAPARSIDARMANLAGNMGWVFLGGGVGSALRYLISWAVVRIEGGSWPYATLAVNVLGSFLLAVLLRWFLEHDDPVIGLRLALTTGMMGGFTTYSTFNFEVLGLLQDGHYGRAGFYAGLTAFSCLLAGGLGLSVVRYFVG